VEVKAALAAVHAELLRVDAAEQDGRLLCDITCALVQALEHAYLLKLTQPPRPAPDDPAAAALDPAAPWPLYRPGNPGYSTLTDARAAARGVSDAKQQPLYAEARKELTVAATAAQAALAKIGDTPCQALIELHARIQQLLDEPGDVAAAASASQKSTAKVRGCCGPG